MLEISLILANRDPIYQDMASKFFEHIFIFQADATAWMGFFCSIMLEISLILANRDPIYQDMASKFFEHYVAIIDAMNNISELGELPPLEH